MGDAKLNTLVEPDFDSWVAHGHELCSAGKRIHWEIGDWWRSGSHAYGSKAKAAAHNIFGLEYPTLRVLANVASKFEPDRRRSLSFSIHAEVASLPASQADAILDRAQSEPLTKREVRLEVKRIQNSASILVTEPSRDTCTTDDLEKLSGTKFGCIYSDPPWLYDNQGTRASTGNHYCGMTVDDICSLPIRDLALDDAHLHLWVTNAFLFDAPRIFDAWGFEFRSSFVWVKPQMGIGNYWRNSHELLLTAIRGDAKRFNDHTMMSWGEFDRTSHSAKPERIREMLQRASDGPFLELFGRRKVSGWTVWGNQIERNLFNAEGQ